MIIRDSTTPQTCCCTAWQISVFEIW